MRAVRILAFAVAIPIVLGLPAGNRVFWTVAIAALPVFWTTFGYHRWRRLCPLALLGQLGRGRRKLAGNPVLLQLGLMIGCLSLRLCGTNGSGAWLAVFLVGLAAAAIATSAVFAGKTWCNHVCPIGFVERIHTEPVAALVGGTQTSQCAPCTGCKKHCPDIDLAQSYRREGNDPSRRLAYYAWPGIVIGFYAYFALYADWDYYWSGRWTGDGAHPWAAGFTFLPAIPVAVAAPLTLVTGGALSYAVLAFLERAALAAGFAPARVRHVMLMFAGLVAFDAFYLFAGQPTLREAPSWVGAMWSALVVVASLAMFVRRLGRFEAPPRRVLAVLR